MVDQSELAIAWNLYRDGAILALQIGVVRWNVTAGLVGVDNIIPVIIGCFFDGRVYLVNQIFLLLFW